MNGKKIGKDGTYSFNELGGSTSLWGSREYQIAAAKLSSNRFEMTGK
jgi:hypothetical protein